MFYNVGRENHCYNVECSDVLRKTRIEVSSKKHIQKVKQEEMIQSFYSATFTSFRELMTSASSQPGTCPLLQR